MSFVEDFWGTGDEHADPYYAGFDILGRRLKESQYVSEDIVDFFSKRAAIEKNYYQALTSLASSHKPKLVKDDDTIHKIFASFLDILTSKIADQHQQLFDFMRNLTVFTLKRATTDQKVARKRCEDNVLHAISDRAKTYKKLVSYKTAYYDATTIKFQLENAAGHSPSPGIRSLTKKETKKADSTMNKLLKADIDIVKANTTYKNSIKKHNEAVDNFTREFKNCCQEFEQLELNRFSTYFEAFTKFASVNNETSQATSQVCNNFIASLHDYDYEKDLVTWINANRTGSTMLSHIEYEPETYFDATSFHTQSFTLSSKSSSSTSRLGSVLAMRRFSQKLAQTASASSLSAITVPKQIDTPKLSSSEKEESTTDVETFKEPGEVLEISYTPSINSGTSADAARSKIGTPISVSEGTYTPSESSTTSSDLYPRLEAIYDYEKQGEKELSYTTGDIFLIVDKAEDPWWLAKNIKTGDMGMIYKDFIKEI